MGLFSKYANLYFIVGRKIIEAANENGGITRRELDKIANQYGVLDDNYDFTNALIKRSREDNKFHGIHILEPADAKTYRSVINNTPIVLSTAEMTALVDSLSSDIASVFVSGETLAKLGIPSKNSELAETLGKVVVAIKTGKRLVFDNNAANGRLYSGQHLQPHKIEYSLSTGKYYVSGYCKESGRLIKCHLERMTIHAIEDGEAADAETALIQKRCSEPISLTILNQKHAIDCAFNMFSCYEKDGFYDKKANRYSLDIYYYEFEEGVLIHKILSLGAAAIVVSPLRIKEEIERTVKEQLSKLT